MVILEKQIKTKKAFTNFLIKICEKEDIDDLMLFINDYWQENHILSKDEDLLKWQYYNEIKNRFNFVLAKEKTSKEIIGILGYIPTYKFDASLEKEKYIWLSIWKVRENLNITGFGFHLLNFLRQYEKPNTISAIGINENVAKIYNRLNYQVGFLNQYFMINETIKDFNLIRNFDNNYCSDTKVESKKKLIDLTENFSDLYDNHRVKITTKNIEPKKTLTYYSNRYLNHPYYNYKIVAIKKDNLIISLIVYRIVKHENTGAIRIVDHFGNQKSLVGLKTQFQKLLKNQEAEYLDFFNYGYEKKCFVQTGFRKINRRMKIIIPNYYEPFKPKNVKIMFANKSQSKTKKILFKGDSDQDRPNLMV